MYMYLYYTQTYRRMHTHTHTHTHTHLHVQDTVSLKFLVLHQLMRLKRIIFVANYEIQLINFNLP